MVISWFSSTTCIENQLFNWIFLQGNLFQKVYLTIYFRSLLRLNPRRKYVEIRQIHFSLIASIQNAMYELGITHASFTLMNTVPYWLVILPKIEHIPYSKN